MATLNNFKKSHKTKIRMQNLIIETINNLTKIVIIILKIITTKINLIPHLKNLKTPQK